ncbi:MAG: hypothetical protein CMM52_14120 [Rhodospirillaceae bacterium]|nr:hypothetical protein [Rhodospirillaceae bacterium]
MKTTPLMKTLITTAVAGAMSLLATAQAGTLENMERERAILLDALLSSELEPAKRQQKIEVSRNRLIDLERMVLRDKSLAGKNTPAVRAAFENYDLTFLVHASVEHNRSLMEHWLLQVGFSSESLMNAKLGRR